MKIKSTIIAAYLALVIGLLAIFDVWNSLKELTKEVTPPAWGTSPVVTYLTEYPFLFWCSHIAAFGFGIYYIVAGVNALKLKGNITNQLESCSKKFIIFIIVFVVLNFFITLGVIGNTETESDAWKLFFGSLSGCIVSSVLPGIIWLLCRKTSSESVS